MTTTQTTDITVSYRGLQIVMTVEAEGQPAYETTLHHERRGTTGMVAPSAVTVQGRRDMTRAAAQFLREAAAHLEAQAADPTSWLELTPAQQGVDGGAGGGRHQ